MSFEDIESHGSGRREYVATNEAIIANIRKLSANCAQLQKLERQLGTSKDTHDLRESLHLLTEQTRKLARETGQSIKMLGYIDGGAPHETQYRKTQQQKLSKDFQAHLKKFQEITKLSAQKERETLAEARKSMGHRKESSEGAGSSAVAITASRRDDERQSLLDERTEGLRVEAELQFNETIIAEREEGIREIEKTIVDISDIFKDLAVLVHDQGSMIDNIESNISNTAERTDAANTELRKANKYQKKTRNRICCLTMIILIIMLILILVVTGVIH